MKHLGTLILLAAFGATACGSASNTGGGGNTPTDASTGTDAATGGGDASSGTDARPTTDTSSTTDRPSTADSGGSTSMFGQCGMAAVNRLCGCGPMDANCQNGAISSSQACVTCFGTAVQTCCPAEFQAIAMCAQMAGCMDEACAQRMCARQYQMANTCFAQGQMTNMTCQAALGRCFGSFPPPCM